MTTCVILIESRQALISYQDDHMLVPLAGLSAYANVSYSDGQDIEGNTPAQQPPVWVSASFRRYYMLYLRKAGRQGGRRVMLQQATLCRGCQRSLKKKAHLEPPGLEERTGMRAP